VTSCLVCITVADSELSLIGIGRLIPHTCSKCVLLIKTSRDQMRLCWWKNNNRTKTFIHTSLTLGTLNMIRLILCTLFILITWVTRSEGWACRIWVHLAKKVELLNLWKDCLTLHNVTNFTWLQISSSKDKIYDILAHSVKTMRPKEWCYEQS
jgi:hypothetical protein